MPKAFKDLTESEILALAVSLEEEDGRIYGAFADHLRADFPATAEIFERMRGEEAGHRNLLLAKYRERFGEHLPLIRRQDVKGFVNRPAVWLSPAISVEKMRRTAEEMEMETRRFYE
ncbi:MAG: ferritin family protein, partial [Verrucomicrobiae bacterium]|nr:ferritin family protein [Verrucomicrobiae bacterium]